MPSVVFDVLFVQLNLAVFWDHELILYVKHALSLF